MAVNARSLSGGPSFFDFSGELRNAIYEHFIDLEPSVQDAINLACVHKQIHSEFGTLFTLRDSIRLETAQELDDFLNYFFVRYPTPALKDIPCHVEVVMWCGFRYSFDLLPAISVLRQYPLLEITWFERHAICGVDGNFISHSDDLNFLKSFFEEMDAQHFKNLLAVNIITRTIANITGLSIIMEKGFPIQTVKEWGRTLCGFDVKIGRTDGLTRVLSNFNSVDDF
ncbi:hypothetical protein CC77DRAFT_1067832 [Alternaria alternata]|uniref:Uncharacterized protein n=1 Tax=Alternaria alternata TaxID=5599 RepID=A0A177D373_ALTAL|nr:hypothetical protein CC77DRAFT_1067832 [Alternaria alternata]OAG13489.1 hypothetical protein CC77DRAFT_1067832 [Alternaria alternata]